MEVYIHAGGKIVTILLRKMVKGGDVSIRVHLVFPCEKSKIVRSIALANTRENENSRALIYTKGIVQYKMPRSAGYSQK